MPTASRPFASAGRTFCVLFTTALAAASLASAQTHKVASTGPVLRAVGVYEWTGDLPKPAASRLVPVTLFIEGKLQDAGVYKAQPVPFALDTGTVYELQKSGVPQGTLNLAFSRKLVPLGTDVALYDDGWFGYGRFHPPAPEKKSNLRQVTPAKINGIDEENDDKPHFSARSAIPGSGASAAPLPGTSPASSTPASDPDRPTLHRPSGSGASDTAGLPDDPDRPTLAKRPSKEAAKAQDSVTAVNSPIDDPNRPTLHRGKPEGSLKEDDLPRLVGLPHETELHQMVAVSDAKDRPLHDFSRPFDDDAEHATVLAAMQNTARTALTAYEKANGLASTPSPASPSPKPGTSAAHQPATHKPAARKSVTAPTLPPESLSDEQLTGFTLSYGGSPTFVYTARAEGGPMADRFVTLVAQRSAQGALETVLTRVTDASHLDRTARLKLVDAVDAEASNRASLLFELRAQRSRQFALYRVIGGTASQIFLTGSTQ